MNSRFIIFLEYLEYASIANDLFCEAIQQLVVYYYYYFINPPAVRSLRLHVASVPVKLSHLCTCSFVSQSYVSRFSRLVAMANWITDFTTSMFGVQLFFGSRFCPVGPCDGDLPPSAKDVSRYRFPIVALISPRVIPIVCNQIENG